MTPSRAEDRKSTKTSPRRRPKRKTAALDTRAERCRAPAGVPRADAPTVRREEIDAEFRRRQVAAGELVRFGRGDRGPHSCAANCSRKPWDARQATPAV